MNRTTYRRCAVYVAVGFTLAIVLVVPFSLFVAYRVGVDMTQWWKVFPTLVMVFLPLVLWLVLARPKAQQDNSDLD